ncbi:MAG: M28 family peptidase [Anaerolineae bacterium]|nr:M28 family peptidase [Anaerolineae bacterium]
MSDTLSAESLLTHVRALAEGIGPRPAGHPEEERARQYVLGVLTESGYKDVETLPFLAPDTWGYAAGLPLALALAGNGLGRGDSRIGRFLGGLFALLNGYALWEAMRINKQPVTVLAPRGQSADLIVRIPPTGAAKRRLVLLAHTDSNKHRPSFTPQMKQWLPWITTVGLGLTVANGLAQLAESFGAGKGAKRMRWGSALALLVSLGLAIYDEQGTYVPGANDNASAVAVVLGLAARLKAAPLRHTEVWLAFTGSEESGCVGAHKLLDVYGALLRHAWFLDFEMVGSAEIAYVTRHSGFSKFSTYYPDAESVAWAEKTALAHPEFGVHGRDMIIGEEVGALRSRGYRGICISGVGPDGWLENWHQHSDSVANITSSGLAKAAGFAWEMLGMLDREEVGF